MSGLKFSNVLHAFDYMSRVYSNPTRMKNELISHTSKVSERDHLSGREDSRKSPKETNAGRANIFDSTVQ